MGTTKEGKMGKGPAGMGSNIEFRIPDLRYIAFFAIFP